MLSFSLSQRLAMDPRCKGMPLSSFLLKPMQRVTRYPLIIKNVCTPLLAHVSDTEAHFTLQNSSLIVPSLLIADLRKYSRVAPRPQPPEGRSGESRGAVFTGKTRLPTPCPSECRTLWCFKLLWCKHPRSVTWSTAPVLCVFVSSGERGCQGEGELRSSGVDSGSRPVWGSVRGNGRY